MLELYAQFLGWRVKAAYMITFGGEKMIKEKTDNAKV